MSPATAVKLAMLVLGAVMIWSLACDLRRRGRPKPSPMDDEYGEQGYVAPPRFDISYRTVDELMPRTVDIA